MKIKEKVVLGWGCLATLWRGGKKPFLVSWQLTKRCNLRCTYCHSWLHQEVESTPSQALALVRSLRGMGTRMIRFTGGEPLLRQDLPALVNFCGTLGIFTGVASNGALFPEMTGELKGLSAVSFSLDGEEHVHDAIRGPGSHRQVIKAIEAAKQNNIYTTISVTLSDRNVSSIAYILGVAREFRVKAFFQPAIKTILYSQEANPIAPDVGRFRQAMDALIKEKPKNKCIGNSMASLKHMRCWPDATAINCVAGKLICRIEADGRMYPCPRFKKVDHQLNVLQGDVGECFGKLAQPSCGQCWCSLFVELNLLSRLRPDAIIDALLK